MSPTVNNFVHDLVAMAKAMEDLPVIQNELFQVRRDLGTAQETIQSRELAILEYKATIDSLLKDKQALEVARDDAELRFLEADDRAAKALGFVGDITVTLDKARKQLEPIVASSPEPTPVISDVNPIAVDPTQVVNTPTVHADTVQSSDTAIHSDASQPTQGQSEADPTDAMGHIGSIPDAPNTNATSTESVAGISDPALKPYAGKRYSEVAGNPPDWVWISFNNWIGGGGTAENYNG